MMDNGDVYYLHGDHLGSTVLETDDSGNRHATQNYFAFGARRGGTGTPPATENQFTSQKQDATGLYYYNARYYDPAIGQFVSPDTLVPDASRVSDWNRYAYARGNPLKYSDPSGHLSQDEISDYFGYSGESLDQVRQMMTDDGWASSLVNWLSDADTQFGDVFSFFDAGSEHLGEAMLALFETEGSWRRTYRGGFYGVTGEGRGVEVYRSQIATIDGNHPAAADWEKDFGGNYALLPKKTGSDYRNYYDTQEYRQLSSKRVAGEVLTVYGIASPAAAKLANKAIALVDVVAAVAGVYSISEGSHKSYPVIPLPRPVSGNSPLLERFDTPRGHYQ